MLATFAGMIRWCRDLVPPFAVFLAVLIGC